MRSVAPIEHDCGVALWQAGDRPLGDVFRCVCGRVWQMVPITIWTTISKMFLAWHSAKTGDTKFWRFLYWLAPEDLEGEL